MGRHLARSSVGAAIALMATAVVTLGFPATASAASFVVDTVSDTVDATPGDGVCADSGGDCSLRAAVMEANALGGTHDITISRAESDPQAFPISIPDTGSDSDANGDLNVTADISITVSPRPELDVVPGLGFNDRAFRVAPGGSLTLTRINVRSFTVGEPGGGILNEGALTLGCGVHVEDGNATDGGGVYNGGTLNLSGAASVRNNTANRGGNLFAAAGSTTTHDRNPACPSDLQLGEGNATEGGAVYAEGSGTTINFNHDLGVHDTSATTSGGAFQVTDDAEVRFNNGELQMSNLSAPTGTIAHVRSSGSFVINPGPPDFSVEVIVDGASTDPGGSLFDAQDADLELTDTEIVNSQGHAITSNGNARVELLRIAFQAGAGGDDGIVLTGGAIARMTTGYIANREDALRIEDTSQIELIQSTLIDNATAASIAPGANVSFRGVWAVRNGTSCTRVVDVLDNSAISDTDCGSAPGSITDPSAESDIVSYDYLRTPVFGPGSQSAVVNLYPPPCLASPDLGFIDRPGPADGGCEPGAVESNPDDGPEPPQDGPVITGTLVLDGTLAPATGACVGLFPVGDDDDEDGGPVAVSTVDPQNGAWQLGPLFDGEYMIAFYPCVPDSGGEYDDTSDLHPELWENVPIDVESDNPIVGGVVFDIDGEDVAGIDACIGTTSDGGDETCGGARVEQEDPPPGAPTTTSVPPPAAPAPGGSSPSAGVPLGITG